MNTRRLFLRRLLADIFAFGLIHSIAAVVVFEISYQLEPVAYSLLLAVPFALMSVIRRFFRNIYAFLLLHMIIFAAAILLPIPSVAKGVAAIFIFVAANYSLAVRKTDGWSIETSALVVGCIANTILVVFCSYSGRGAVAFVPTIWAFIMLLSYVLFTHTHQLDTSLEIMAGNMRQPIGTIIRFNNSVIAIFLLIAALLALLSPYLPLDELLATLLPLVLAVIVWLLNLIQADPTKYSMPEQSGPAPGAADMGLPEGEASIIWEVLEQLVEFLILAALAAGIAAFLIVAVYNIYKSFFAKRGGDGDKREYIGPAPIIERIGTGWRGFLQSLPSLGDDESARIRKTYYKKVRRHMRRGIDISKADTTGEIEQKIKPTEDISELTETYNKARYRG